MFQKALITFFTLKNALGKTSRQLRDLNNIQLNVNSSHVIKEKKS